MYVFLRNERVILLFVQSCFPQLIGGLVMKTSEDDEENLNLIV